MHGVYHGGQVLGVIGGLLVLAAHTAYERVDEHSRDQERGDRRQPPSLSDWLMPDCDNDRIGETDDGHVSGRVTALEEREPEQRRPQVPDAVVADALSAVVDGACYE